MVTLGILLNKGLTRLAEAIEKASESKKILFVIVLVLLFRVALRLFYFLQLGILLLGYFIKF